MISCTSGAGVVEGVAGVDGVTGVYKSLRFDLVRNGVFPSTRDYMIVFKSDASLLRAWPAFVFRLCNRAIF